MTPQQRFERFLSPPDENGCVIFRGGGFGGGDWDYGSLKVDGQKVRAHRFAWEQAHGPLPRNVDVHHVCENVRCVNLDHLQALTRSEHATTHSWGKRNLGGAAFQRAKTHCPYGHAYNEENTLVSGSRRYCRACLRRRHREARQRKTAS